MPTNLNALIRYKTLDRCFRNRYGEWTLEKLAEKCSEALDEARGRKAPVSVRTIQDDIRVMRSDILGFNAPIEVRDGIYFYSDPDYSISQTGLSDLNQLRQVYREMLAWWEQERLPRLEQPLARMAEVLGETFPPPEEKERAIQPGPEIVGFMTSIPREKKETPEELSAERAEESYYRRLMRMKKEILLTWKEILMGV